jgi:hypothetical protein
MSAGIPCEKCGRWLANAHAIIGWDFDPYIHDVRGDCAKCGPDQGASHEAEDCWWFAWESWDIDEERLYQS